MKKCDLHVHSCFSNHPNEWFLKRIGASESYTTPEEIYTIAKSKGMDYVTITDHNTIDGVMKLKEKYPEDVFTGVELTTYFPEDSCKIHILVYDFTEKEFLEMDNLRKNIYELSDYIMQKKLAHSVAHPTYRINNILSLNHFEKLLLLFDNFEVLNASRDENSNFITKKIIQNINSDQISRIESKYFLKSTLLKPWQKGCTAGSDDHSGLFISKAYTTANVKNLNEFIESIKNKNTTIYGFHNNYYSFVFTIYKIAYEFYKSKNLKLSDSFFSFLFEVLFKDKKITLKDKFKLNHLKKSKNKINNLISELLNQLKDDSYKDSENRFLLIYNSISNIVDELLKNFFHSFEKNSSTGDIYAILKNISSALPAIFLSLPFFTSIMHFNQNRLLIDDLIKNFNFSDNLKNFKDNSKILWFTDTLNDLNGVSTTIKLYLNNLSSNENIKIVTCKNDITDVESDIIEKTINLPSIYSFNLPFYESIKLNIPSILQALKIIQNFNPDEILISTPGPVGLIGLISSKLLNVKSTGIFHTDFSLQTKHIINDESFYFLTEKFLNWFYSNVSRTLVPTYEYIGILTQRGYDTKNFQKMKRGIDLDYFYPIRNSKIQSKKLFNLPDGKNLLYAGRISEDKNLDFLFKIFKYLNQKYDDINLIIAGDGPYLEKLKENYKNLKNIYFLGKIESKYMPIIYSSCFAFIFPSTTDTFGMAVLEAQACGSICLVSDIGGPKEIVINNETGFICPSNDIHFWIEKIEYLINIWNNKYEQFLYMKNQSRLNAVKNFNIYDAINFLFYNKSDNSKDKFLMSNYNFPYLCFNINQK